MLKHSKFSLEGRIYFLADVEQGNTDGIFIIFKLHFILNTVSGHNGVIYFSECRTRIDYTCISQIL